MDNVLRLNYPSSIYGMVESNESFDSCVIKICYHGKNRNGSFISKKTIEDALNTIYNCPIVCNYNAYDNTIGGHDTEIISDENGMKLVNLTDAIGVIPSGSNCYWEAVDENGEIHEYLCVEAILWKRSSAYGKIKDDGIVSQSMEISVKNGQLVNGVYEISQFVFTAFCLLGDNIEPCFESASLESFCENNSKSQFALMMEDFKKHFSTVTTSNEDDIDKNFSKGGNDKMDRMELLAEYGLTIESLDFNIEDFSIEELREKFEEIQNNSDDGEAESGTDEGDSSSDADDADTKPDAKDDDEGTESGSDESFSLSGEQFRDQLMDLFYAIRYEDPYWGECLKYGFIDYDTELAEAYCYDWEDYKLYGFSYSMNGDNIVIDFDSKKRKKFAIVDFDEGSADFSYESTFSSLFNCFKTESEKKQGELSSELETLKEFKATKLAAEREEAEKELFAQFADLNGVETFEQLRTSCSELTLEQVESKCYEIRGRNGVAAFSINKPKSVKIAVEKNESNKDQNEPYGGLFVQYPPTNI